MPRRRWGAKHPVIKTGIYSHMEKWKLDKRTSLYRRLEKAREGLLGMFAQTPPPAVYLLIDRIIYKGLKLLIYETMDLQGANTGNPHTASHYLAMSNSLREDLRLLLAMARQQEPAKEPDLQEYLRMLGRADKAIRIKGEEADEMGPGDRPG